jgi:hypothetical protein
MDRRRWLLLLALVALCGCIGYPTTGHIYGSLLVQRSGSKASPRAVAGTVIVDGKDNDYRVRVYEDGGYSVEVSAGTYTVTAELATLPAAECQTITTSVRASDGVPVDLICSRFP